MIRQLSGFSLKNKLKYEKIERGCCVVILKRIEA